jgi:oligoendopeptidase F
MFRCTLDRLEVREDELYQQMRCLELELERQEDTSIDSASLWVYIHHIVIRTFYLIEYEK